MIFYNNLVQAMSYHNIMYLPSTYIIIIHRTHESRFKRQNIFIAQSPKGFVILLETVLFCLRGNELINFSFRTKALI